MPTKILAYVAHRLQVAGAAHEIFTSDAIAGLALRSGAPRLIIDNLAIPKPLPLERCIGLPRVDGALIGDVADDRE